MRKTKDITIGPENAPSADGRDYGKTFRITEMPAFQAERWGTRATLALIPRLTREVSAETADQLRENPGMLPVERIGALLGGIAFPETASLMEEIFQSCVQFIPDARNPQIVRAVGLAGAEDIEDVMTIAYLRQEALSLHTNFTLAAGVLNLISAVSTTSPFSTIPTSQDSSEPSSPPERPRSKSSRRFMV